jgi:hypothetical protein
MTPFTPPPDWTEAPERRAWEREKAEAEASESWEQIFSRVISEVLLGDSQVTTACINPSKDETASDPMEAAA